MNRKLKFKRKHSLYRDIDVWDFLVFLMLVTLVFVFILIGYMWTEQVCKFDLKILNTDSGFFDLIELICSKF